MTAEARRSRAAVDYARLIRARRGVDYLVPRTRAAAAAMLERVMAEALVDQADGRVRGRPPLVLQALWLVGAYRLPLPERLAAVLARSASGWLTGEFPTLDRAFGTHGISIKRRRAFWREMYLRARRPAIVARIRALKAEGLRVDRALFARVADELGEPSSAVVGEAYYLEARQDATRRKAGSVVSAEVKQSR